MMSTNIAAMMSRYVSATPRCVKVPMRAVSATEKTSGATHMFSRGTFVSTSVRNAVQLAMSIRLSSCGGTGSPGRRLSLCVLLNPPYNLTSTGGCRINSLSISTGGSMEACAHTRQNSKIAASSATIYSINCQKGRCPKRDLRGQSARLMWSVAIGDRKPDGMLWRSASQVQVSPASSAHVALSREAPVPQPQGPAQSRKQLMFREVSEQQFGSLPLVLQHKPVKVPESTQMPLVLTNGPSCARTEIRPVVARGSLHGT